MAHVKSCMTEALPGHWDGDECLIPQWPRSAGLTSVPQERLHSFFILICVISDSFVPAFVSLFSLLHLIWEQRHTHLLYTQVHIHTLVHRPKNASKVATVMVSLQSSLVNKR